MPLQRLGTMDEYAWLITMLCSPLGHDLSGSVVTLDGALDNWEGPWPRETMVDERGVVPTEARKALRSTKRETGLEPATLSLEG